MRLERRVGKLPQAFNRLEMVDTITAMWLTVGGGSVADTWHRVRERMRVTDDGSSEERIRQLREARDSALATGVTP